METPASTSPPIFRSEWPLLASILTAALFMIYGATWLDESSGPLMLGLLSLLLFAVITLSSFAVVRHAEDIAAKIGELP
jgi:Ca2+/H+ antiporter